MGPDKAIASSNHHKQDLRTEPAIVAVLSSFDMPTSTISIAKVISTCGLGLLSGYAIASPLLITPTLESLSTRATASRVRDKQGLSLRATSAASAVMAGVLATTFTLSPEGARHPYLLYASVLALSSAVTLETFGQTTLRRLDAMTGGEENPDAVEEAFTGLRWIGTAVAAALTTAFAVSVVGNYGDFY